MTRKLRKKCCLGFCILGIILSSNPSFSQSATLQHLTTADGLSQGMVYDILQDKDGFIWATTKNGLNRYDGVNFKVFYPSISKQYELPPGGLRVLFQDTHGRMWIGTENAGLHLYDSKLQRFYKVVDHATIAKKIPNYSVWVIREDEVGNIWIGTSKGSILKVKLPPALNELKPEDPADLSANVQLNFVHIEERGGNSIVDFIFDLTEGIIAVGRRKVMFLGEELQQVRFPAPYPPYSKKSQYQISSIYHKNGTHYLLTNQSPFYHYQAKKL